MDDENLTLPMRISITVALISYFLMMIFIAILSWDLLLEKQRISAGPWTSGVVVSIYTRKADEFGAVTYKIETSAGVIECRENLSLGPKGKFIVGQAIELAIGLECGKAVSVTKRVWPWFYFCLFVFSGMFPVIGIARECAQDAKQAAKGVPGAPSPAP